MSRRAHIDRAKHAVDVMEHVLKGVHTDEPRASHLAHLDRGEAREWLGGAVMSAVQIQMWENEDDIEVVTRSPDRRQRAGDRRH